MEDKLLRFGSIFFAAYLFATLLGGWVPFGYAQSSNQAKTAPSPLPDLQMIKGRIVLHAPTHPLLLGKSNELVLDINGPQLKELSVIQRRVVDGVERETVNDGYAKVSLQHRADGRTYIDFVPLLPGRLGLQLDAIFSDGAFEVDDLQVDVVADVPPVKLQMDQYGRTIPFPMTLDFSEEGRTKRMFVQAIYSGIKEPIYLDPKDMKFEVQTPQGKSPIQFDHATGEVHALHVGRALITAKFQGLEQKLCVVVSEDARYASYLDRCKDLIENIDKGVTAEQDAEAFFALTRSRLPYVSTDTRRGRFIADERVELVPPAHALQLARDSAIGMKLHGPELVRVECSYAHSNTPCEAWTGEWPRTGLTFSKAADGNGAVHVFPQDLGDQEFNFIFLFADGGSALKKIRVPVELGDVKPQAFGKWCNQPAYNDLLPVALVAPSPGRASWPGSETLVSTACYRGLRGPLQIPAKLVHYELHTAGGSSPVEFDATTGKVTAVREGDALITQTFAGLTYATCVKVRAPNLPFEHDVSNCRKLRAAYGAELPPLEARVREVTVIRDGPPNEQTGTRGIFGGMGSGVPAMGHPIPGPPPIDAIEAATISPDVKDEFPADGRLTLLTDGITAVLGSRTTIPLQISGPKPLEIFVHQWVKRDLPIRAPGDAEETALAVLADADTIWRAADGSLSVRLKASQLGMGKFQMKVLFADGGVAAKTFALPVKLPDGVVPVLVNNVDPGREYNLPATTLHLRLQAPGNIRNMFPAIELSPKERPIPLSPHDVKFSVKSLGTDPVIDLDNETGKVTALRVGHALLTMRFAGVENQTCVVVLQDPVTGDASNCEELRSK